MPRSTARREGSPFTGLGPVFMKELSDHLSSTRMMVLTLFVIVFGALPVASSLQELRTVDGVRPVPVPAHLHLEPEQRADLLHRGAELHHSADGDRPGLRLGEQRIQPPHAVARAVAADLSRRAAAREVPGRPGHAGRRADGAVADRVRRRPAAARPAAARRRGGARRRLPAGGHRLWRRVAGSVDAVLGDLPLDRDLGALRAGPVAVLLHPVADDRLGDHHGLHAGASRRASSTRCWP